MLEISELSVGYPAPEMVRAVSLDLTPGEAVCLIGPNGAGKTTTLRGILGLANRLHGTVTCNGVPADDAGITRMGVAYVPEGRHVFPLLTVEENLLVAAYALGVSPAEAQRRCAELYDRFDMLGEFRRRDAGALSGGQQQIMVIARALMQKPKYLLIDEPSLGLSPVAVDQIAEVLRALVADGLALLLVEQRVELCLGLCDRGYVLVSGEIVAHGSSAQLQSMNLVQNLYFGAA